MFASKESKLSYDSTLVEEQFKHAVKTGLRDDLLRGEMQTLLKTYDDDEELVAGLSQITKELEPKSEKPRGRHTQGESVNSLRGDKFECFGGNPGFTFGSEGVTAVGGHVKGTGDE
jgi:hypothetical protein